MYYVYKVEIPEHNAIYIGCTNDIRRRKDQHNGNATTGLSYFGRFLSKIGKRLEESDLKVVREFNDRPDALKYEKNAVLALHGTGVNILNDIYSDHCSRVGLYGKANPTSKTYMLVDIKEHTTELVEDVHGWCNSHGIQSYKTLIGTAKGKPHLHLGRYAMRDIAEWDSMSECDRNYLVSGEWYNDLLKSNLQKVTVSASKRYLVETPSGEQVEVFNLEAYAKEHGVNPGNLHGSYVSGKTAAGYRVIERLS